MPGVITTELGKIAIPDDVIATIAGYAATENYGIVGMSAKTAGDQFWQIIGGDNQRRGVKITSLGRNSWISSAVVMAALTLPIPVCTKTTRRSFNMPVTKSIPNSV